MSFKELLTETLDRIPGGRSIVFMDYEGEAVDWACRGDEYEVKFLGAHLGILMQNVRQLFRKLEEGEVSEIIIRHENSQLIASYIKNDYYLVVILEKDASAGRASYEAAKLVELFKEEV